MAQPRIITWRELTNGKFQFAFMEISFEEQLYPVILEGSTAWSPYINKHANFMKMCEKEEYGVNVRCWTHKPTYKRRKGTPWETFQTEDKP